MPLLDYGNELSALGGDGPIVATQFSAASHALDAGGGKAAGATPTRDWGAGDVSKIYARVTQAFNNLTSLDVELIGADDSAGTNPVSYSKTNFLIAALTLNAYLLIAPIMPGLTKKRFLLARYTPNGTAPTTGKITLGLISRDAPPQDQVPGTAMA